MVLKKRLSRRTPGYEDLGFARVDHDRARRCGFPEVIFCPGKTPQQVAAIARAIYNRDGRMLATRAERKVFTAVKKLVPIARYNELGRTITAVKGRIKPRGVVHIITAGTSDIPVAEEAADTAAIMGNEVRKLYDAGVAGIHRLLENVDLLADAKVVIVVAGMEGALPSVVGGLVRCPVIAVPTSIGYGAHFQGLAALLAMLNSCASNVVVTNIDNGFRAGYVASLIAQGNNKD
ncbi:MAG: nickel pincer cofactor biosynthesis protein LarB [Planctomycetota bacterium]